MFHVHPIVDELPQALWQSTCAGHCLLQLWLLAKAVDKRPVAARLHRVELFPCEKPG